MDMNRYIEDSAQKGVDFLKARPGLACVFSAVTPEGWQIPIITPANETAAAVDRVFGEQSGATYAFVMEAFLDKARRAGFDVRTEPEAGRVTISAPGARPS